MTSRPKTIPEFWIFAVLLTIFLGVAYYAEQAGQAVVAHTSPSSLNARPQGSRAIFDLFQTLPYTVHRLTASWNALTNQDGLVVVIEPLDSRRAPTDHEIAALRRWTENGGTVLYFVTIPARPLDPKDTLAGDITIYNAIIEPGEATPSASSSPITHQVGSIAIASAVRLKPAPKAPYTTLFQDWQGILVAQKPLGKGSVIVVADTYMVSNAGINQADNVVLLANIAANAIGSTKRVVQFDEYHHGVGFETEVVTQENWISTLPTPIKRAAIPLLCLLALIIYNGNRRFGTALPLPPVLYRPSTDYVHSLARWLRRANATDVVLHALHADFRRALTRQLAVAPDIGTSELLTLAAQRHPELGEELSRILLQGDVILAGQRPSAADMLEMARRIETVKRRLQLVGDQ